MDLTVLSEDQLIKLYTTLLTELRRRGISRTANLIGDIGEYYARKIYHNTSNKTTLIPTYVSTKNVDEIGTNGISYAIKSISGPTKSVLQSIPVSEIDETRYFDFLVIVWNATGPPSRISEK